jgi:lipoate-protein ligase A
LTRTAQRKVKGGKLVRVKVDDDGSRITRVSITGDFFVYPEEGLLSLEEGLAGTPLGEGAERLLSRLNSLIRASGLVIVGFEPRDLAELISEASW